MKNKDFEKQNRNSYIFGRFLRAGGPYLGGKNLPLSTSHRFAPSKAYNELKTKTKTIKYWICFSYCSPTDGRPRWFFMFLTPRTSFLYLNNDLSKILTSRIRFWRPQCLKTWFCLHFSLFSKNFNLFLHPQGEDPILGFRFARYAYISMRTL